MFKYTRFVFTLLLFSGTVFAKQPPQPLTQLVERSAQNSAPVFTSTSLPAATEDKRFSGKVLASDSDSKELYFRLVSGPEKFELSENGRYKWHPGFDAAGEYQVQIAVSDGELTTTKTFNLKVINNNRSPEWKTEALKAAVEGKNYVQQLMATDPDADTLKYTLLGGLQGLTVSSDGTMEWSPGFFVAGKHTVKVSVSDGESVEVKTFRLEVENTNRSPQWLTDSLGNATEGKPYEVQFSVSDLDKEKLKFSLDEGPKGLKVSREGRLSWIPSYDDAGKHTLKVSVSDPFVTVAKSFTLLVDNTNRQPEIQGDLDEQLEEMSKYSFVIEADDPDGDKLTYKIEGEPEGVHLNKKVISWTPGYEQAGEYNFLLTVSDQESSATKNVVWHVKNTNRLPEWQTAALAMAKENTAYQVQLLATDADKSELVYKLESGPRGMTVSAAGQLKWLPDFETSGAYDIELSVSDGEDSVTLSLSLKVENTNRPPVFTSLPLQQVSETNEYRYKVEVDDPDREVLNVKLVKAPSSMRLVERELIWTPDYEQAGVYDVELELTDAEAKVYQKFKLTVDNTNRLPVFETLSQEARILSENTAWEQKIQATDADRQSIVLKLDKGPEGLMFGNNTLQWTPTFEQAGEYPVQLSASDGEGSVNYDFMLTVKNVNRQPFFTSKPLLSAKEVAAYQYTVAASDPDRTPLVYALKTFPPGMSIIGSVINWTPGYEQSGKHLVVVQVADGEASVEQSFTIEVENTNREPVFNSKEQVNAKENSPYVYNVDVSDPDLTPIELKLVKGPDGMELKGNVLSWAPDFESAGSYPVILELTDKEAVVRQGFNLLVENTNRLPEVTSKPVLNAVESFPYSYQVTATDADRQALTITLASAPNGMTINNGLIEWIPGYKQQGTKAVVVDINDSEDSVKQKFNIKVKNSNREPNIASIDDVAVIAGDEFEYQVEASDKDGDEVSVRIEHGPKKMDVNSKGVITWKTKDKDIGNYTVVVSVSDGDLEARTHFNLYVLQRTE